MDDHNDVLPQPCDNITFAQKEETALRHAYNKRRLQSEDSTRMQRRLQQEIDNRKTDAIDLQNIEEIKRWSRRHKGRLPIHTRADKEQMSLAKKLDRLQS